MIHAFQLLQHEAHGYLRHMKKTLALTVQSVGREYVRYFNQRWGRTGTSGMVDINLIGWTKIFLELNAQKYLDQLSKTSGLTNNEIEWGWSTCAHYCGVFSGTNHIINMKSLETLFHPFHRIGK